MKTGIAASLAIAVLLGSVAQGQLVAPPVLIGTPTDPGRVVMTVTGASNPANAAEVTVAWQDDDAGRVVGPVVRVAQSSNGGASWSVNNLPLAACSGTTLLSFHPLTTRSFSTNTVWVGARASGTPVNMRTWSIVRRPPGAALESTATAFQCTAHPNDPQDGTLAAGPRTGGTGEVIHALYTLGFCGTEGNSWSPIVGAKSDDSFGYSWSGPVPQYRVHLPGEDDCQQPGEDLHALIIQSGQRAGRIVTSEYPSGGYAPAASFNSRDGGQTWELTDFVTTFGPPGSETGILRPLSGQGEIMSDLPGLTQSVPRIAAHPSLPTTVYMLFTARLLEDYIPPTGNLDLYLARMTIDAEGAFHFLPENVVRLTDSMVGDPSGTDQVLGNLTVDSWGGIDIVYYGVSPTGEYGPDGVRPSITPRYARFSSFPAPGTNASKTAKLASKFDPLVLPFTSVGQLFLPEYLGITSSGCVVYTFYMSAHEGFYGIYANKITVCLADSDFSGSVTGGDPLTFANQYIAQDPAADLNGDESVGPPDVVTFQEAFACGCGAP